MLMNKQDLRAQALALPPVERAALIEDLLSSFAPESREEIDAAWAVEAEERLRVHDEGHERTLSLDESKNRIGGL